MRSSWRFVLIGVVLCVVAVFLWNEQIWLKEFIAKHARVYFKQLSRVYPIIIGTLIASIMILLVELCVVGWRRSSLAALLKPSKSAVNDIFLWLLSISQIGFMAFYLLLFNFFKQIRPVVREALGIETPLIPALQSSVLQLVVFILVVDFVGYILHYFMHFIPPFWHFHKVHHSATEFNGITSERAHPVETHLIADVVYFIPFAIVGFPLFDVSIYVGIRHFMAMLHHSRLDWDWGWVGKYVLGSPQYHRIHHSMLPQHVNKNIAIIFPIWDHIFGTYCGDRIELNQLGVENNQYNKKSVVYDFFLSFQDVWHSIIGRFRRHQIQEKDRGVV